MECFVSDIGELVGASRTCRQRMLNITKGKSQRQVDSGALASEGGVVVVRVQEHSSYLAKTWWNMCVSVWYSVRVERN